MYEVRSIRRQTGILFQTEPQKKEEKPFPTERGTTIRETVAHMAMYERWIINKQNIFGVENGEAHSEWDLCSKIIWKLNVLCSLIHIR